MSETSSPSTLLDASSLPWIAQRIRTLLKQTGPTFHFLYQPWQAKTGDQPATPLERHLIQVFDPMIQRGLTVQSRSIDRAEPLALGMSHVLRCLHRGGSSFGSHGRTTLLQVLLPLYLSINCKQSSLALSESCLLAREYVCLHLLDSALEGDLSDWLSQNPTFPSLHHGCDSLQVSLTELAQHAFDGEAASHSTSHRSLATISDERRRAYWALAQQWVGGAVHLAIPKELGIERASWPQLRTHFSELLELLQEPVKDSEALASTAMQLLQRCEDQVEFALEDSDVLGGTIGEEDQALSEDELTALLRADAAEQLIGANSTNARTNPKAAKEASHAGNYIPNSDQRVVELRSSNDPKLLRTLEQQLSECRIRQGSMALVVVRLLEGECAPPEGSLAPWQLAFVTAIREQTDCEELRGFIMPSGEVAMILEDVDRGEATNIARESMGQASVADCQHVLSSTETLALIAGIAYVSEPNRGFRLQQLTDAAWRCLEGAVAQGAGAAKSLEVF